MTPVRACGVVVALLLVCVPLHAKVYTSADDEELFDQFRGKLGMKPSPLAFVTLGRRRVVSGEVLAGTIPGGGMEGGRG